MAIHFSCFWYKNDFTEILWWYRECVYVYIYIHKDFPFYHLQFPFRTLVYQLHGKENVSRHLAWERTTSAENLSNPSNDKYCIFTCYIMSLILTSWRLTAHSWVAWKTKVRKSCWYIRILLLLALFRFSLEKGHDVLQKSLAAKTLKTAGLLLKQLVLK